MTNETPTGNPKKQPRQQLPDTLWWTIALLVVSAVITASALALIYVPGWIVESTFSEYRKQGQTIQQTALVNATSNARQTVTLAIGGIIAIVTFVLSLAKHRVTKQEHALENSKNDREQEKHAQDRDTLWANRYSEALSQFTNEASESIRLGGIYSLERIAQESENDRQAILEVLCSYLRENFSVNRISEEGEAEKFYEIKEAEILAVRDVVARLLQQFQPRRLDLSGVNLNKLDLSGAKLVNAQLDNADLSDANLHRADLSKANLHLAQLPGATLTYTNLSNANLKGADFKDAKLQNAYLTDVTAHWANFDHANLALATFRNSDCLNASFESTKLDKTRFTNAVLNEASFEKTDLTSAIFDGATMNQTKIIKCLTASDSDHHNKSPFTLSHLKKRRVQYDPLTPPQVQP